MKKKNKYKKKKILIITGIILGFLVLVIALSIFSVKQSSFYVQYTTSSVVSEDSQYVTLQHSWSSSQSTEFNRNEALGTCDVSGGIGSTPYSASSFSALPSSILYSIGKSYAITSGNIGGNSVQDIKGTCTVQSETYQLQQKFSLTCTWTGFVYCSGMPYRAFESQMSPSGYMAIKVPRSDYVEPIVNVYQLIDNKCSQIAVKQSLSSNYYSTLSDCQSHILISPPIEPQPAGFVQWIQALINWIKSLFGIN